MQSNIHQVEQQLVGVWVPTYNRSRPDHFWPRLVFAGERGYFEDGDFPVIYSVETFSYRLVTPTVLEIVESSQEYLNDDENGIAHDDSWVEPRFYDLALHLISTGLFLEIELSWPPPKRTQYFKTDESVEPGYSPSWRFI